MCGFLFVQSSHELDLQKMINQTKKFNWRGPDDFGYISLCSDRVFMGHRRLAINEVSELGRQPMFSKCGRYVVVFNGEIYNHQELRLKFRLNCYSKSDTETLIELYSVIKEKILEYIDGMFSLVIYDSLLNTYFAARDRFGIKPLYYYRDKNTVIFCSEASVVRDISKSSLSEESINEWKLIRTPLIGYSFYHHVYELKPASCVIDKSDEKEYWRFSASARDFDQHVIQELIESSVKNHQLSEVSNVSLLSGGLDSSIITSLSAVDKSYCIGINEQNEIKNAMETAELLNLNFSSTSISYDELIDIWRYLIKIKREPLSVPNEGLIYKICSCMLENEKVVLSGEGADEIFFGYDNIYRWAMHKDLINIDEFISRYSYSNNVAPTNRLLSYIENLSYNKSPIEFVEDFFYKIHLPCLLRRMDFASMAASKEVRVPFVSKDIVDYMYRRAVNLKIDDHHSKKPLRKMAIKLGLDNVLKRKKIGFSASPSTAQNRFEEYTFFQDFQLKELQWL